MRKYIVTFIFITVLVLAASLPAGAQDGSDMFEGEVDGPEMFEAEVAVMPPAVMVQAEELAEPPPLTEEQLANQQWAEENTPGALPVIEGEQAEVAGPEPGTESKFDDVRGEQGQPLVPGTKTVFRWKQFVSVTGYESSVMEASVDGKANKHFFSGNWFGARSTNKGINWSYLSPYSNMTDFCCDQIVRHDTARNIFLWLRMGAPDATGENRFTLSVDFNDPFTGGYHIYSTKPENVNGAWQNMWWDYPAMSLTADYLYLSWNMFDNATPANYVRTVVLKWPLDALATGAGFGYGYINTNAWASIKPVDGADHTMYMASTWPNSVPQNSRVGIWRWRDKDSGWNFWNKTVPAWTFTKYNSTCGTPNWLLRSDQRALAGARYNIDTSDISNPGRNVVAWWWNVAQGGGYTHPYVNGAAFYEDTMTLVPGSDGRPLAYSGTNCFAYPDVASNQREDLGMVLNYSFGPSWHRPYTAFGLADDYNASPPGWSFLGVVASSAGPSNQKWGDYNTTRAFNHLTTWIAGAHYISNSTNCSNCSVPLYFSYGRERDQMNYWYW